MLSILNILCHGYVAIPVIAALRKQGLFKILSLSHPVSLKFLVEALKANEGYLKISLCVLESLGWVCQDFKEGYRLTIQAQAFKDIPEEVLELYQFKTEASLLSSARFQDLLIHWIQYLLKQDKTGQCFQLLQGPILVPLLIAIHRHLNECHNESSDDWNFVLLIEKSLPQSLRLEVNRLLLQLDWLSETRNNLVATKLGEEIVKRAFVMGIAASYRPMLFQMNEVLFGDTTNVFKNSTKVERGQLPGKADQLVQPEESHVDRSLNVISSGSQHERYFGDAEKLILARFGSSMPFSKQPKYIVDMGCGDGTFLKRIYNSLRKKTPRGRHLHEYPVTLIGADYNEAALIETEKTLEGLPHLTLKGDINDPEKLLLNLNQLGIKDHENILHVRSFLDHNFRYTPSFSDENQLENPATSIHLSGVYVDSSGKSLSSEKLVAAWKQHFLKWANALRNNSHGLLILEAHCLTPQMAGHYFEQSESFYFDALHAFSGQYLIDAELFLTIAANEGLFTKTQPNRYPKTLPFCRITLSHFEKRDYTIRYAAKHDLKDLYKLDRICWPKNLQTPKAVIRQRVENYPEGQFVLSLGNKVVGVIYSQRIDSVENINEITANKESSIHTRAGSIVQLLSVNIDDAIQDRGLGDQLLEFMLQRCSLMNGIQSVVGVTLCKDYEKSADISLEEYIKYRDDYGNIKDPILRFHEFHGARIDSVVSGYRPKDIRNEGNGVLISYDIHFRIRKAKKAATQTVLNKSVVHEKEAPSEDSSQEIEKYIKRIILTCLGESGEIEFSNDRPLMEMGLDSADLLELNQQVLHEFSIELEPTFFFRYNTPQKVINYIRIAFSNAMAVKNQQTTLSRKLSTKSEACQENSEQPNSVPKFGFPRKSLVKEKTDIAIVGASCLLPGRITSPVEFWEFLRAGGSGIRELPEDRFIWPSEIDPWGEHQGINRGGFLDDIATFDASFFRISATEAESMDPQQRILLELSWHCLEDAGCSLASLSKSCTGVFVGASGSDYSRLLDKTNTPIEAHFGTGSALALLPNRISYFFDFSGPSLLIDTACSSSLVAVHKAVQSLHLGECNQALVSGINIISHPGNSIAYYKAGMLSPDGKCKTFDKEANGYVRAEGAVVLLLRPLEKAIDAKDRIYAVIRGTSCNHGGQAGGLTVPNPEKQTQLLERAWSQAEIFPETLGYIETHGTGTSLGDPIEIQGIKTAFKNTCQTERWKEGGCGLGSLKSNFGHLEAASGIAGLLKAALSLRYQELVPTINFAKLNSQIQFQNSPFYIITRLQPWSRNLEQGSGTASQNIEFDTQSFSSDGPLRAGVSSFGFGGANAHVVLEEYQKPPSAYFVKSKFLPIVLSAKNQGRLQAYALSLLTYLESKNVNYDYESKSMTRFTVANIFSLESIFYTLQKREPMEERVVFLVSSIAELKEGLDYFVRGQIDTGSTYVGTVRQGREAIQPFLRNEKMKQIFREWVGSIKIREIAMLWAKGLSVDWGFLFEEVANSDVESAVILEIMDLPKYPFEKKRYWLPELNLSSPRSLAFLERNEVASSKVNQQAQMWQLLQTWNQCHFEDDFSSKPRIDKSEFLVLATLGFEIEKVLNRLGQKGRYIEIPAIDSNHSVGWTEDFWNILVALKKKIKTQRPTHCLFLSNSNMNFSAMLYAALQSLGKEMGLKVQWISWNGTNIVSTESVTKLILQNAFRTSCSESKKRLVMRSGSLVCEELKLSHRPLEISSFYSRSVRSGFKESGVYWIVGGNGGIGRKVARLLADEYGTTVVLTGRSTQNQLEELDGDRNVRLPGFICYRVADCTNRDEMKLTFSWIMETYGQLNGVIHAAGVIRDKSLLLKSKDDVYAVMQPKVEGSLILDGVTKDSSLDFFILFSSITALLGTAGQCDYAAANVFLKQFAEQRRLQEEQGKRSGVSIVIHWPYWAEGGMQLEVDQIESLRKTYGYKPLPDEKGLALLDYLVLEKNEEIGFIYGSLPATKEISKESWQVTANSEVMRDYSPDSEDMQIDFESVQKRVIQAFSEVTHIDEHELDVNDHFFDFGIDSILLNAVVKKLNGAYRSNLTMVQVHNHPTISKLSVFIADRNSKSKNKTKRRLTPISQNSAAREDTDYDVAIVGVNLRVPGADTLTEFWDLMMEGSSAPTSYPKERWDCLPEALTRGERREEYQGYFLKDILRFDHKLFKISPREAMLMDPQQRLLLHSVWKSIENAGYSRGAFSRKQTSVFLSINKIDYADIIKYDEHIDEYTGSGVSRYIAANRISHFFNLQGLSESIDTACSSFFVGLDKAIDCLKKGLSEQAIVAGVQLNLLPSGFQVLKKKAILSRQNKTLPFDQNADGFVRGEGVGSVILKPLQQAVLDKDSIYAVLKGTGVWHAGKSLGLTAPNSEAHQKAMKLALQKCSVSVDQISYLEAHGTGMPLGDASEVDAFCQVFRELNRDPTEKCIVSAVKPNIGHLEAASGVAVLAKAILTLQKGQVPGITGFKNIHSEIDSSFVSINNKPQPLPVTEQYEKKSYYAGLNSYGLGGVSAFVLLKGFENENESEDRTTAQPVSEHLVQNRSYGSPPELFVISAQSENILNIYINTVVQFLCNALIENQRVDFRDIIATYQLHREHMPYRLAIISYDVEDLIAKVKKYQDKKMGDGVYSTIQGGKNQTVSKDMQEQWLKEMKWEAVAEAWVSGVDIDWPIFDHSRLPLPGYPFNNERKFWISQEKEKRRENRKYLMLEV